MTRHTSGYLRQRTSNLSLRSEAATNALSTSRLSSFANPSEFENESTISDAVKAFIVGDLARSGSVSLCDSCLRDIPKEKRTGTKIIIESDTQQCSVCDVLASKPEAFTEPFCKFLQENPTVFHSVGYFKDKLNALDYKEVSIPS